jgi:hypothetical protein
MLPTASDARPRRAAVTLTASSGSVVPTERIVTDAMAGETPSAAASRVSAATVCSPPT